jgi:Flp pilus assembly protein TadD
MPHFLMPIAIVLLGLFSLVASPVVAAGSSDGSSEETASSTEFDYEEAKALVDSGDFVAALPILIGLTNSDARNADAWNLLGYTQRKLGHMDESSAAYLTVLTINPDHLGALEYQGELFVDTGKPDLARANLARLQSLCGDCEQAEDLAKAIQAAGV